MSIANQISRRSFVATTAKLGMAGLATARMDTLLGAESQRSDAKVVWQMGCYTRVFDQFEYPVALDAIAEAGFKYVGLMTTKTKDWVMSERENPNFEFA